jgi:hypothetical protein
MQKTHLHEVPETQGIPPPPAPRPAYAKITRLLHRRRVSNQTNGAEVFLSQSERANSLIPVESGAGFTHSSREVND